MVALPRRSCWRRQMIAKLHQDATLHLLNTAPTSISCESPWVHLDLTSQMAKPKLFDLKTSPRNGAGSQGKGRHDGTGKGKKNKEKQIKV
ncbi:hypothetical protein COLO4_36839 [Corchorus olitorius]|uniref:Uncharacterized protein n=1 Tax=Corchorus olitorius TaxID=93759 RepID=A0A1R3G4V8_9ROSI|nr:hypothetical protein COLO4_36839 [Corchorus olitorius]